MRVLHFFKTYLPDSFTGIERVIFEIAESTASLGVHTDVLSLSRNPARAPIAIGRHYSHQTRQDLYVASTGLSLSVFAAFRRLAAQADIVHYHFPWPMMDLVHSLVPPGKPALVTYHSDIVKQQGLLRLYSPVMHRFLGSVDAIVATSPNYARSSSVLAGYGAKLSVVPIGIADQDRAEDGVRNALRARVGERFFLFVGALRYYKGLPFLLEAARMTGLPVVIAGAGDVAEFNTSGLANVTFLGEVSDAQKLALLELCTAFVFPSHLRSEAFGVALLEAARAGKAMISCEIGTGTSYVNETEVTGFTVPPADPARLGQAMKALWDDPGRCQAMGAAARARYERLFTARQMGASYGALYQRLISGHKGEP
ncbi:MAG: glycosyl transferase family 1 [Devosia sp.]|nr:glycosyl transferase family 1 [Devosia sp.]